MIITNFSSGELSPTLNGRIDLQQYFQAAQKIENFEIIPTGGIRRRTGSKRLTKLEANSRIIPFILDKNNVFIFQAYAYNLNIWKLNANGTFTKLQTISYALPEKQPTSANFEEDNWYVKNEDDTYSRAIQYDSSKTYYINYFDFISLSEIQEIQYSQNYDTFIMAHRNHAPIIFEYSFVNKNFACSRMHFNFIPNVILDDDYNIIMLPVNALPECIQTPEEDGVTEFIYDERDGTTTKEVTKIYPKDFKDIYCVFNSHLYKWKNEDWEMDNNDQVISKIFSSITNYPGCVAFFNNRLYFASTIANQQKIWASATPDETGTRYNDFSTYTKYITVNRIVKDADLHVFTCDVFSADVNHTLHQTTLRNVTQDFTAGLAKDVEMYFITGDNIPIGTKIVSLTSDTITIDTDKMSIPEDGLTNQVYSIQLWRNAVTPEANDYEFVVVNNNITRADNSFNFEVASDENDAIMFLSSNKFLAVGTESSIWSIAAGSTALEINAVMQGRYGSDTMQGHTVATATIYLAQGKKGIREFYFDSQSEAFQTNNIAILAEQMLTESPAVDFDYMTNPYNRLLITRADGTIVSLLYDKNNGVMGWNRITRTQGTIKSLAVTRGDEDIDFIFVVVQDGEDEDGNPLYYLEMIDSNTKVYLDSWKVFEGAIDGYSEDAMLHNVTQNKIVQCNSIPADFMTESDEVYIGYPIKSYIKSMPVMNNNPNDKKRIVNLIVRFLESDMPVLKVTGLPDENFYDVETPYSGVKEITYPGQSERDVFFEFETCGQNDVCILSVNAKIV